MKTDEKIMDSIDFMSEEFKSLEEFPRASVIKIITNSGRVSSNERILVNLILLLGDTKDEKFAKRLADILIDRMKDIASPSLKGEVEVIAHMYICMYFANPGMFVRRLMEALASKKAV